MFSALASGPHNLAFTFLMNIMNARRVVPQRQARDYRQLRLLAIHDGEQQDADEHGSTGWALGCMFVCRRCTCFFSHGWP